MIIIQQANNIKVFDAEDLGFWTYNSETDLTTEHAIHSGIVHSWQGNQLCSSRGEYVGFEARLE